MERLMHAETAWLSGQKRGEILQAVSDDVETVKRISVSTLPQFLYMLLVAVTSTVTIARVYYPVQMCIRDRGKRAVLSKDRQPVLSWQKNVWHGKRQHRRRCV